MCYTNSWLLVQVELVRDTLLLFSHEKKSNPQRCLLQPDQTLRAKKKHNSTIKVEINLNHIKLAFFLTLLSNRIHIILIFNFTSQRLSIRSFNWNFNAKRFLNSLYDWVEHLNLLAPKIVYLFSNKIGILNENVWINGDVHLFLQVWIVKTLQIFS